MNQQHNPNQPRGNGMHKQGGQMNMGGMPQPPMQNGPINPQQMSTQQQQPGAPQQAQMNQQIIQLPQIDISKLNELKGQPQQLSEFVGNSIYGLIQ